MPARCMAWLFDGGQPQHAGVVVRDVAPPVWVAAPIVLSSSADITQIGVAAAKAVGWAGMGYQVYLATDLWNVKSSAIATWTVSPSNPIFQYYYYYKPNSPVRLEGGKAYFLVFTPNSNNFSGSISWSASSGYLALGTPDYGTSWSKLARPLCIRIDGNYVPEPSCAVCILVGILALTVSFAGKQHCGFQPGAGQE